MTAVAMTTPRAEVRASSIFLALLRRDTRVARRELPFFLLLCGVVWAWGRRLSDERGAAIAVLLTASDPNLLAYAGLATPDIALAATITVPAELGHPQRIESAIKKHELSRARWIKRIEQCRDEVVAHAVIAVVREFWTHNAAFEEALARLDDSHWREANRKALRELRRMGWGQEGEA